MGLTRKGKITFKMKRVLITGGSGFIGAAIVNRLLELGHDVTVLDDNSRGSLKRLQRVKGDFKFIEGSITDKLAVTSACQSIDSVVHLAYVNGTKNFYERPGDVLDVGIRGMLNLGDAMFENKIPELVLASSSEVYQQPTVIPTPEKVSMVVPDLENPRYSYGLGKIVQEFYSFHAIKHLERLIIFRPHNVYGPNMGSLHVVPQLIEKFKHSRETGEALFIEGDGRQTRSFCFIDDFVDAFELIYMKGQHKNVYNIGTSDEISIRELAQKIAKLTGYTGSIETSKGPKGGTSRRLPDIKKIAQLGFIPKIGLEEGLRFCIGDNNEV